MARQRRTSEITRMLKRRMTAMNADRAMYLARELREFALVLKFKDGWSAAWLAENEWLSRATSRDDIERFVRTHTTVKL